MSDARKTGGRVQLVLVAAVFLGPLALAAYLYFAGQGLAPEGRTNNGSLLQPIVNLPEALPGSSLHEAGEGRWVLLYADSGPCEEACRNALHTLRQSRLMLGKEMDRVVRIFLHGNTLPDTVWLADEHGGLMTLQDGSLGDLLENERPASLEPGGLYLMDPLGNLVMYFPPDLDPQAMVGDIRHLLELSRIG
ncbi:MAG: hypothetical protein MJA32_06130 [Proteobacteria bacterium]|nr:hypothetical protein [Pseudomonadota bacterium]